MNFDDLRRRFAKFNGFFKPNPLDELLPDQREELEKRISHGEKALRDKIIAKYLRDDPKDLLSRIRERLQMFAALHQSGQMETPSKQQQYDDYLDAHLPFAKEFTRKEIYVPAVTGLVWTALTRKNPPAVPTSVGTSSESSESNVLRTTISRVEQEQWWFLYGIITHPRIGYTQLYSELGLNPTQGGRLREIVEAAGLVDFKVDGEDEEKATVDKAKGRKRGRPTERPFLTEAGTEFYERFLKEMMNEPKD